MAKKNQFYAIKKGQHPGTGEPVENQILEMPWTNGAELYVRGVTGAKYKGCKTRDEAVAFLADEPTESQKANTHQPGVLYCYVDGSYNKDIPNYAFGLVCVLDEKVVHVDRGIGRNQNAIEMFQIAGELLGSMKALLFAKKGAFNKVEIRHDYLGVAHHATGYWKRKNDFSETYHQWMQGFFRENPNMTISFAKVDAHTGDDFNELADGYAKLALGITPNPIFFRMAEKHQTQVA